MQMRGIVLLAMLTAAVVLTRLRRSGVAWFVLIAIWLMVASVYLLN